VRLHKTVQEHQQTLQESLVVRAYKVERIRTNRPVQNPPEVRLEGNRMGYPVAEERLVLAKQLVLVEEVRLSLCETQRMDTHSVVLRREHLEVERVPIEEITL
jgi:stress response protein YsnF